MNSVENLIKQLRAYNMNESADKVSAASQALFNAIISCNDDVKQRITDCASKDEFKEIGELLSLPKFIIQCIDDTFHPSKDAVSHTTRYKRPNNTFQNLGIPVGAILTFIPNPSITCTVINSNNRIEYNGNQYTLTSLTKHLQYGHTNGFYNFSYNNIRLTELRDRQEMTRMSTPDIDITEE